MAMDTAKRKPTDNGGLLAVDFHCHVLPNIDDGSDSTETTLQLLSMQYEQGVRTVFATPHFRAHRDDVSSFLARRRQAVEKVAAAIPAGISVPKVKLGAEIAIEHEVSEVEGIEKLTMGKSPFILLELPYKPYRRWTIEEIENIAYKYDLIPVIAHLDRYAEIFSDSDYAEILQLNPAIFQINNEGFVNRHAKKLIRKLIGGGYPVILGSDCHNLDKRPPNFGLSKKSMSGVVPTEDVSKLLRWSLR